MQKNIKELSLEELEKVLESWQEPHFRARQILTGVYKKAVTDFSQMRNLPSSLRDRLKKNFSFFDLRLVEILKSQDATQKFLFDLDNKYLIEAAVIPAEKRITGCISTQVGCKFACRFCASGLLGFKRNLGCGEMLDEVLYLKNNAQGHRLTHLVFMGMGEPLDNYDNVLKAIRIINSPETLNVGARRITISTCGIIPGIKRLANEGLQIELSVSLHAADDKTRSKIIPINKIYPLKELLAVCRDYIKKTNRQITFEYILIKGINSDLPSAQNLIKILADLKPCKINLIPCNPIKELNIEPPHKLESLSFKDCLIKGGLNVTLRRPRGQDINAACGQLRLRYEK
jgi:23S rRNA (adenine2503-C2)-methyltransferase